MNFLFNMLLRVDQHDEFEKRLSGLTKTSSVEVNALDNNPRFSVRRYTVAIEGNYTARMATRILFRQLQGTPTELTVEQIVEFCNAEFPSDVKHVPEFLVSEVWPTKISWNWDCNA